MTRESPFQIPDGLVADGLYAITTEVEALLATMMRLLGPHASDPDIGVDIAAAVALVRRAHRLNSLAMSASNSSDVSMAELFEHITLNLDLDAALPPGPLTGRLWEYLHG